MNEIEQDNEAKNFFNSAGNGSGPIGVVSSAPDINDQGTALRDKYEKLKKLNRRYIQEIHRCNQMNHKLRNEHIERRRTSISNYDRIVNDNKRLRESNESLKYELHTLERESLNKENNYSSSSNTKMYDDMAQRRQSENDTEKLRICLLESEEHRKDLEIRVLALLDYLKDKDIANIHLHQLRPSRIDVVDKQHEYDREIAVLKRQMTTLHEERRQAVKSLHYQHQSALLQQPAQQEVYKTLHPRRRSSWPQSQINQISMPQQGAQHQSGRTSKGRSSSSNNSWSQFFNLNRIASKKFSSSR